MVLDDIDPLPDRRPDYYMAQLTMMVANRWRDPKSSAYELSDFLLFDKPSSALPSDEELAETLTLIFG